MKSQVIWFTSLLIAPAFAFGMGHGPGSGAAQTLATQSLEIELPVLSFDGAVCGKTATRSMGSMSYCMEPGTSSRVLISFPGVFNNEFAYQRAYPQSLRKAMKAAGQMPTIFTINLGTVSFLNGHTRKSGRSDVQEVIEALSKTLVKHGFSSLSERPGSVDLLGESMGGHNSIMIYLRAPQLFRNFALMCPALSRISPFINEADWLKSMDEDGEWYRSLSYKSAMQYFFRSQASWDVSSPLWFGIKSYIPLAQPGAVFVTNVQSDYFGFNSGGREFIKLMKVKGHPVEAHVSAGKEHC
ncbi:MAG: alpha/beta hydrolase-fold protein, partial [Bdellovibrionota bacterium]